MRIQITLTSQAGKRVIARGIKGHPLVRKARNGGRILLKGGTTVSAVSEELCGRPMKISGMITPRGTLTSRFKHEIDLPHALLLENGRIVPLDSAEDWERESPRLTPDDLVITGANAFDAHGHAAIMAGTYAGGSSLPFFQPLHAEGVPFLVAAGLEKLVPGNLLELIPSAGRKKVDYAYGMAVGLVPIFGEIFTEVEALESLGGVKALVIGKGGIHGAEGSSTLLIDGPRNEVLKIEAVYREVKGAALSGHPRNLIPCNTGSRTCGNHIRCLYKKGLQQIPHSNPAKRGRNSKKNSEYKW